MNLLEVMEGDSWRGSAVRGASAVVFGILALVWPGPTVWVFVVLFGVYALVDGFAELGAFIAPAPGNRRRNGAVLFRAFVSMTVAVIAFAWPGITALGTPLLDRGLGLRSGRRRDRPGSPAPRRQSTRLAHRVGWRAVDCAGGRVGR